MRGVVLAGGTGSRLGCLAEVTNKHLLPVGDEPMVFHPLRKLVGAGIRDILVVTGMEHAGDVFRLLGSGSRFAARFTYRVQDEAGGIAQALLLARGFVGEEPFCAILGDNVFQDELRPHVERFLGSGGDFDFVGFDGNARGMILLAEVADPQRFGVARFDDGGRLVEIVEKPAQPPSSWAVAGVYFYGGQEVFDLIDHLRPSARGELEITDLNNALLAGGHLLWSKMQGWWTDAGTPESLQRANRLIRGG